LQFSFKFIIGGASFATPCKHTEFAHSVLEMFSQINPNTYAHIDPHGHALTHTCTRVIFYLISLLILSRRKSPQNT